MPGAICSPPPPTPIPQNQPTPATTSTLSSSYCCAPQPSESPHCHGAPAGQLPTPPSGPPVMPLASSGTEWGQPRQLSGWRWDAALLTLMCILARFRRLSVVWRVLSGPRGTSCLSCSRYSLSLARLKKPETEQSCGVAPLGWWQCHTAAQRLGEGRRQPAGLLPGPTESLSTAPLPAWLAAPPAPWTGPPEAPAEEEGSGWAHVARQPRAKEHYHQAPCCPALRSGVQEAGKG